MAEPVRAAITGGPGVGKSTLISELGRRGLETRPEVARALLQDTGGMELREANPLEFALAMLEAQRRVWDEGKAVGRPIIFDRGFPDIVGFLRVEGLDVPAEVERACRIFRFDGPVFRAPPWQAIYRRDDERIQEWEDAVESDRAIADAWREFGYEPIDLPLIGVRERADFVIDRL